MGLDHSARTYLSKSKFLESEACFPGILPPQHLNAVLKQRKYTPMPSISTKTDTHLLSFEVFKKQLHHYDTERISSP